MPTRFNNARFRPRFSIESEPKHCRLISCKCLRPGMTNKRKKPRKQSESLTRWINDLEGDKVQLNTVSQKQRLQNSDNNVLQQSTNKVKWPVTLYSLAFWAESLLHLRSYTSSLRPFSTHFNGNWIKMHHCSFYIRKVVLIYDMGKCELLGIKAAVWKK